MPMFSFSKIGKLLYLGSMLKHHKLNNFSSVSRSTSSVEDLDSFITENTEVTTNHLTPEIQLRLITPRCSLWHSSGEDCPITDRFWVFYWPGGQALTRYILDNKQAFQHKRVLDVGSGCGASAIACAMVGASTVTANDICPVAGRVIGMNCDLNNIKDIHINESNLIGSLDKSWDMILLGDMFYDEEFTNYIAHWIESLHKNGTLIYSGDPGRIYFTKHKVKKRLRNVFAVELPKECQWENNGLTQGHVWQYE